VESSRKRGRGSSWTIAPLEEEEEEEEEHPPGLQDVIIIIKSRT
jgi:hypothetical protein